MSINLYSKLCEKRDDDSLFHNTITLFDSIPLALSLSGLASTEVGILPIGTYLPAPSTLATWHLPRIATAESSSSVVQESTWHVPSDFKMSRIIKDVPRCLICKRSG